MSGPGIYFLSVYPILLSLSGNYTANKQINNKYLINLDKNTQLILNLVGTWSWN